MTIYRVLTDRSDHHPIAYDYSDLTIALSWAGSALREGNNVMIGMYDVGPDHKGKYDPYVLYIIATLIPEDLKRMGFWEHFDVGEPCECECCTKRMASPSLYNLHKHRVESFTSCHHSSCMEPYEDKTERLSDKWR